MIELAPLFALDVEVGELMSFGQGIYGERRVVPILGGTVSGPEFNGEIVPGGADWQVLRSDAVLEIEARYAVRTDAGDLIEVFSQGYRYGPPEVLAQMMRGEAVDPATYYFRATMRFQTGSASHAFLNRTLAIARGSREPRWVHLVAERVL